MQVPTWDKIPLYFTWTGLILSCAIFAGRMDGRMNIKHEKVGKKDNESRDGKIHYSLARALIEMQPDKRNRLDTSSHLASKATKPIFTLRL